MQTGRRTQLASAVLLCRACEPEKRSDLNLIIFLPPPPQPRCNLSAQRVQFLPSRLPGLTTGSTTQNVHSIGAYQCAGVAHLPQLLSGFRVHNLRLVTCNKASVSAVVTLAHACPITSGQYDSWVLSATEALVVLWCTGVRSCRQSLRGQLKCYSGPIHSYSGTPQGN